MLPNIKCTGVLLTTKNYPTQNINSAEVERLLYRKIVFNVSQEQGSMRSFSDIQLIGRYTTHVHNLKIAFIYIDTYIYLSI